LNILKEWIFLVNKDEVETYHRDKVDLEQILQAYKDEYCSSIDEITGDEFNYSDLEIEEVII